MSIRVSKQDEITIVSIDRPARKNAVDRATAEDLMEAFRNFEEDPDTKVGVLYGEGGTFCSGADLKAIAEGEFNRMEEEGSAPMGPSRLVLSKPVIAAISGYAVAGGLELALWCDLRVAEESSILGVFCRRWGVPLVDGGTVRLPRIIGMGRALDLIITGRPVTAREALEMGLVSRVVADGKALQETLVLAKQIAALPQACMNHDRLSTYEQCDLPLREAMANEFRHGIQSIDEGSVAGAERFLHGEGRHGAFGS